MVFFQGVACLFCREGAEGAEVLQIFSAASAPLTADGFAVRFKSGLAIRQEDVMQALEFRFAFFARDFERSVAFYRDALGMRTVGGWDRADGKGALLSAVSAVAAVSDTSAGHTAVVEIYGAAEGELYEGPAPVAINLALRLSGTAAVDEFYRKLGTMRANLAGPPEDRAWGHRSFIVYDPDGIPVHIYCEIDHA